MNSTHESTHAEGKIPYHRVEIAIGCIGLLLAAIPGIFSSNTIQMEWASLLRWLGVALLLQGLIRDLIILAFHRRLLQREGKHRGFLICLESTIGVGLIALYFLIDLLGGHRSGEFSPRILLLIFSCVWLFGFATRDLVLEMRRDPNHLNLVFGFSPKKN